MYKIFVEENSNNERHLLFDKQKVDIFLEDLSNALKLILYQNNIEVEYWNFTTTLSTSINNLSIEVLRKNKNSETNAWFDNECKIAIKFIRDASNASLKYDKMNRYKTFKIKRKKQLYKQKAREDFAPIQDRS